MEDLKRFPNRYSAVSLGQIDGALNSILSDLEQESTVKFARSAASNVLVAAREASAELNEFIDQLALVHPSRFFLIDVDDGAGELQAHIALRCHGLNEFQKVCSDLVQIKCPPPKLEALPEVVRANLIAGTTNELLVYNADADARLLQVLLPEVDRVLFDSAEFEGGYKMLGVFFDACRDLVDITWFELEPWRDELKSIFSRSDLVGYLEKLRVINLQARAGLLPASPAIWPSCLLLMGGWLVERLGLEIVGFSAAGFEAVNRAGQRVLIGCQAVPGHGAPIFSALELVCGGDDAPRLRVKIERNEDLETTVEFERGFKLVRPLETETKLGYMRRFFQLGGPGNAYYDALRGALDMHSFLEDLV